MQTRDPQTCTSQQLMEAALAVATEALAVDEVPIGCVIVENSSGRILGRAHNRRLLDADPTAHAEILALRQAAAALGDWRLENCTLAVTLEPCPMCAGAIVNARVARLIYGCADPKAGAVRTLYNLCDDPRLNHRVEILSGVLAEPCGRLLSDFFRQRRG